MGLDSPDTYIHRLEARLFYLCSVICSIGYSVTPVIRWGDFLWRVATWISIYCNKGLGLQFREALVIRGSNGVVRSLRSHWLKR